MKDYERSVYLILYIKGKREYHMIYQYNDAKRYKEKNILHTDIRSSWTHWRIEKYKVETVEIAWTNRVSNVIRVGKRKGKDWYCWIEYNNYSII